VSSTCAENGAVFYPESSPTEPPPMKYRTANSSPKPSTACSGAAAATTGERTRASGLQGLHQHCSFFAVASLVILQCSNGVWENNFVDAQFLQAVWPQELDNVRLLIVFCDHHGTIYTHDWNLFTPRAGAQASIECGREWTGRDVILKLQNGHFTILRHQDPDNHHPIQEMLDKMLDADVDLNQPGERQLLHLESVLGGEPDPTRPMSVGQLHALVLAQSAADPLAACGAAYADASWDECAQPRERRLSSSDDMTGLQ
jgi:hypothetical protein